MIAYWLDVAARALAASFDAIGQTRMIFLYGAVVAVLSTILALRRRKMDWTARRILAAIGSYVLVALVAWLPFFLWFLMSIPPGMQASAKRLAKDNQNAAGGFEKERDVCKAELKAARDTITSEQSSLNTCLVALGRSNAPEPLKITAKIAGLGIEGTGADGKPSTDGIAVVIAQSNKMITPIRAVLECDTQFEVVSARLAGELTYLFGGGQRLAPNKSLAKIESPAWHPGTPLVFTIVAAKSNFPKHCTVTQQQ